MIRQPNQYSGWSRGMPGPVSFYIFFTEFLVCLIHTSVSLHFADHRGILDGIRHFRKVRR